MQATPTTFVTISETPFIGESLDITVSFDNTGNIPGYGPFVLLYLDSTGADGNDGLTFNSATYLGSPVNSQTITLDNSGSARITVFDVTKNKSPLSLNVDGSIEIGKIASAQINIKVYSRLLGHKATVR